MKYSIKRTVSNNAVEITITPEEFEDIRNAKKILSAGLSIEEGYELLLSNYEDLEKEIVSISLEHMLCRPRKYDDFRIYMARLNKRLINFLSTARLYIDYTKHYVSDIVIENSEGKDKVDKLCKEKCDENIEYQFMEKLRNHAQHYGLPVHSINPQSWMKDVHDLEKGVVYAIDLFSEKKWLEDNSEYWKNVLPKLDDKTDLKIATRKYVQCLSEIQSSVREIVAGKLSQARQLIECYMTKFSEENDEKTIALSAIAFNDDGERVDEVVVVLNWDDIRIDLVDKNRMLRNLSLMYVTGETKIVQPDR